MAMKPRQIAEDTTLESIRDKWPEGSLVRAAIERQLAVAAEPEPAPQPDRAELALAQLPGIRRYYPEGNAVRAAIDALLGDGGTPRDATLTAVQDVLAGLPPTSTAAKLLRAATA